jgi:PhnB protein
MQLSPYLYFDGQCEEAFKFYEQVLGGKLDALLTFAGSPAEAEVPAEWGSKIIHADFILGDGVLMGSDCPPGRYEVPKGFSVSIQIDDAAKAEQIFQTLADGGTIQVPFAETFWAKRFGMVVDKFGTPWMINCG